MLLASKTLAAIDKHLEDSQESSHRAHLGASIIGRKCGRELWYKFRWALGEKHGGQLLRLFNTGFVYEPRFMAWLEAAGATVWPHNPRAPLKDGKPQQWRTKPMHDGHFGGSADGVGINLPDLGPGVPFTISCKTHNEKSFEKLREMGVMGSKFEHFVQEQVYLHDFRQDWPELEWCLYMAADKNTDRLHLELLHYDEDVAKKAIQRGADVIYSNEPLERIADSPGAFGCKFCHFNRMCHFGDVKPDRNCRTCKFSRPAADAKWACGLRSIELDETAQREGCGSYQPHAGISK